MFPLLLVTTALAANPYTPRDVHSAETRAMGHTGGATATSNAAITVNPAALALAERYEGVVTGNYGDQESWGVNVTMVDSKTVPLALGIAYSHDVWEPPFLDEELPGWQLPDSTIQNWKRSDAFTLGVAYPFLDRRLTVGVGLHMSFWDTQRDGVGVGGNAHIGIAGRPWEYLFLGLSLRNFVPLNDPLALPTTLRPAMRLEHPQVGALVFEADIQLVGEVLYHPLSLYSGIEGRIVTAPADGGMVAVRAGYRTRQLDGHYISAGFGLINTQASVDYALEIDVVTTPVTLSNLINSLSLRVAF